MIEFITANFRTIAMIYVIVGVLTFIAVIAFFYFICKAEDKERELYSDDDYYYPEDDERRAAGTAATMLIGFVIALGCAVLWWGIPLLLIGVYVYGAITSKFPTIAGHVVDDDESEEETE